MPIAWLARGLLVSVAGEATPPHKSVGSPQQAPIQPFQWEIMLLVQSPPQAQSHAGEATLTE